MRTFLLAAVSSLVFSHTAWARQAPSASPPVGPRADIHGVIGWQNLRQPADHTDFDRYDSWANGIFYGGAGAGYYWTEHLKTQVDYGAGTDGDYYRYRLVTSGGQQTSEISEVSIRKQSLAISQQYQFFRNQWFHPRVAAGIDIGRETSTARFQPAFVYDPVTRVSRQVSPARTEGPSHRTIVRPFAETGFKAYMTPRTFFTTDVRFLFRSRLEEVLFRVGFGVDF
jgi:hypothetical protein